MRANGDKFFGKVMLFGEYSLLCGSAALTVPITNYFARLKFPSCSMSVSEFDAARKFNNQLQLFLEYLQGLQALKNVDFNFDRMKDDLSAGLYLWSSIPIGYGLGSSGALVAAIYHRYACSHWIEPSKNEHLLALKSIFSNMEAFFHGSSSGLDPLTSYLNKPLMIKGDKSIGVVTHKLKPFSKIGGFFLVDTGKIRNTKFLVNAFHRKCQKSGFLGKLKYEYIPSNNACINSIIENEGAISELMKQLSSLQLELFSEMIPPEFLQAWTNGLAYGKFSLKLCGAGGGGYILGYTDDYGSLSEQLPIQDLVLLNELFDSNLTTDQDP